MNRSYHKIQSLKLKYTSLPQPELLIALPNPHPDRDYEVQVISQEFTSLCPVNPGQPDFASVTIKYVPNKSIIELKSLKFYLTSYRTVSIFFEASTNQILNDLVKAIKPRTMEVITDWNIRGGMSARVTATYDNNKSKKGVK